MRLRTGLLLVALLGGLLAPGSAGAGPIHWSYSSVGGEKNGVTLIGRPLTHEESPPGVPDGFSLGPYERFEHGELPWPTTVEIPLQLTITDAESQESRQIEVPYIFHTVQPDPIDLRAFIPGVPEWQFVLGENRYTVYDPAPPTTKSPVATWPSWRSPWPRPPRPSRRPSCSPPWGWAG